MHSQNNTGKKDDWYMLTSFFGLTLGMFPGFFIMFDVLFGNLLYTEDFVLLLISAIVGLIAGILYVKIWAHTIDGDKYLFKISKYILLTLFVFNLFVGCIVFNYGIGWSTPDYPMTKLGLMWIFSSILLIISFIFLKFKMYNMVGLYLILSCLVFVMGLFYYNWNRHFDLFFAREYGYWNGILTLLIPAYLDIIFLFILRKIVYSIKKSTSRNLSEP